MPPSVPEVVDLVVRLEDDPARRHVLKGHPHDLFQAAVDAGLVPSGGISSFAQVVGQAVNQGVLGFRSQPLGAHLPPVDAIWTEHAFQSRIDYFATVDGHQMAALYRQRQHPEPQVVWSGATTPNAISTDAERRDLFISHASEDKDSFVRPLSRALTARGWSMWVDELELTIGDSLTSRIDAALAQSRFGVVVLSKAFFAKPWPQRELSGLAAREIDGSKVILPIWHGVDRAYIAERSPPLADRLAANSDDGIDEVASKLSRALERGGLRPSASAANPDPAPAPWRGIHGGEANSSFVGAHVIDRDTGQRGQVEQVLGPASVLVRLEDGTLRR